MNIEPHIITQEENGAKCSCGADLDTWIKVKSHFEVIKQLRKKSNQLEEENSTEFEYDTTKTPAENTFILLRRKCNELFKVLAEELGWNKSQIAELSLQLEDYLKRNAKVNAIVAAQKSNDEDGEE